MRMPTVMGGHRFSEVPRAEIQRSVFDRSKGYKTTFDAGYLVPIYVDEVVPGDTFTMEMAAFARLATPLKPFMDNMYMDTFFFFVPCRLVWDNWERFMGAQDDPDDSTDFVVPVVGLAGSFIDPGKLPDYFGLPLVLSVGKNVNALPFRARNLIWNEWFRDQNIQDSLVVDKDDGPDDAANYPMVRRGKRHDYFTSCLPFLQKGDSVVIPLGTSVPVVGATSTSTPTFKNVASGVAGGLPTTSAEAAGVAPVGVSSPTGQWDPGDVLQWETPNLIADLASATTATINALRQSFQVQRMLERDARGGTRYTELVRAHFGVTSPDARLQRPEYLGGGSSPIMVSPIAQTSEDGSTPQGNLAAIGTTSFRGHGWAKSFTEHGYVLGFVSVRADLTYQQGLDRMWTRSVREDFYFPALAHIGEQAVLRQEIFCDGSANDLLVFGYQERFAEYRYGRSQITGLFRSTAAGTLDVWHLSQELNLAAPGPAEPPPTLSEAFIVEDPPIDRVIATPTEPHFLFDAYFRVRAARPMPLFGVPGLIDHF